MANETIPKQNDFDPIFRLFTVIYGTVVAFTLKPFAQAFFDANHDPKPDIWDAFILCLLISFFVVDWMWSAAYLLNYWPKRPETHKFYQGFCDARNLRRSAILFCHFASICSFAMFAHLAWLSCWKIGGDPLGCPLLWLAVSFTFAMLWDICMYVGEVNLVKRQSATLLSVPYFFVGALLIIFWWLAWLFGSKLVLGDGSYIKNFKGIVEPGFTHPKTWIMVSLFVIIVLRVWTYFRFDELVIIQPSATADTTTEPPPSPI